jgi:hypothetical protein
VLEGRRIVDGAFGMYSFFGCSGVGMKKDRRWSLLDVDFYLALLKY